MPLCQRNINLLRTHCVYKGRPKEKQQRITSVGAVSLKVHGCYSDIFYPSNEVRDGKTGRTTLYRTSLNTGGRIRVFKTKINLSLMRLSDVYKCVSTGFCD